jgi:hypothetical protein
VERAWTCCAVREQSTIGSGLGYACIGSPGRPDTEPITFSTRSCQRACIDFDRGRVYVDTPSILNDKMFWPFLLIIVCIYTHSSVSTR